MDNFFSSKIKQFNAWISSHGGVTKVGAAAIVVLGIAYGSVPEFHAYCVFLWSHVPTGAKTFLVTLSALYAWFRNPATEKIVDSILGPGDKLSLKDPVLDTSSNVLSASSATVTKADVPPTP